MGGHPFVLIYADVTAALMPVMLPKAAHAVRENDRALNGTVGIRWLEDGARRLINQYEMVLGIAFAGAERDEVAHGLNELHRPVAGTMPDGSKYHAWNSDVWAWTWGSILKSGIDIWSELRGFRSPDEQEAAYQAWLEIGRRFGVRTLPSAYPEFEAYWNDMVDTQLAVGSEAQFIVDNALHLAKPRRAQWLPTPLWRLLSLPVTRTLRVGILIAVPERFHRELGLRVTRLDLLERRVHGLVMRAIPLQLAGRFAPTYFWLRGRYGTPAYRAVYSRAALAERRASHDAIRREKQTPRS
jgi:uncharacterized protein (DUF2236 family)